MRVMRKNFNCTGVFGKKQITESFFFFVGTSLRLFLGFIILIKRLFSFEIESLNVRKNLDKKTLFYSTVLITNKNF